MSDIWEVGEDLPVIEEGVYEATLIQVEDTKSKLDQDKPQLLLRYRIEEQPHFGVEVVHWVNAPQGTLRPKMGLYKIAEALLGVPLASLGRGLTRADLMNRRCRIVVEVKQSADGTQNNRVTKVMRSGGAQPAAEKAENGAAAAQPSIAAGNTQSPAERAEKLFALRYAENPELAAVTVKTAGAAIAVKYDANADGLVLDASELDLPTIVRLIGVLEK